MGTSIHLIEPATAAQLEDYYALRWRELREPWGQPRGSERDDLEGVARHLAVTDDAGITIGVGRLHFNEADEAQIRYMATAGTHRGRGVGSAIIRKLESIAVDAGSTHILINARLNAVAFYQKLGYEIIGDGHVLYGTIHHKVMRRRLCSGAK